MGNDIKITLAGNDAAMIAVWQRQNAEILKNQKSLVAMKQAADEMGSSLGKAVQGSTTGMSKGLSDTLGSLKSVTSGFIGVAGAIKGVMYLAEQLKQEYEHLRGQQSRAGAKQAELAPLQREMFENLGDDKTLTAQMANLKVAEISAKTSMSPGDVMKVMSTALSFKERSATAASVVPLVEMAASMSPESGGDAAETVKAMQAISKIRPDANAKDIQGFLIGAKLASPVVNSANFGSYTAPGIAQLMSLGNTAKESAAFQGALGQGIGDEEGRVTATASITFQKQLKEMLGSKVEGGVFQQLAFLQTPEGQKYKKKLLGPLMAGQKNAKKVGLEGEAKAFATLVGFIQGEGRYNEILQGTLADTPDIEGAGSFVDTRQATLENDPLQQNYRMQRLMQSAGARSQLKQIGAGKQGITLAGLKQILDDSGVGAHESAALIEAYKIRTEGMPEGITARAAESVGLLQTPGALQSPEHAASQILAFESNRRRQGVQLGVGGESRFTPNDEDEAAADALLQAAQLLRDSARKKAGDVAPKAGPGAANQRGAAP